MFNLVPLKKVDCCKFIHINSVSESMAKNEYVELLLTDSLTMVIVHTLNLPVT